MHADLHSLLDTVQAANDLTDLRERLVSRAMRFFGATRGALFVFAEFPPDAMAPLENPVVRALLAGCAPVHEGSVLAPGQWQTMCRRTDHSHVLAGPLVQNGELVGVLAFTRTQGLNEFDARNLADLSALCLHVSTRLQRVRGHTEADDAARWHLTARETQIALLVAQGLTNAQIAARLGVSSETVKAALKRAFRKVGVSSRAALAVRMTAQMETLGESKTPYATASASIS